MPIYDYSYIDHAISMIEKGLSMLPPVVVSPVSRNSSMSADALERWIQNQSSLGEAENAYPVSNLYDLLKASALMRENGVELVGSLLQKVKADPEMTAYQNRILEAMQKDPRFGKEAFTLSGNESIEFGGARAPGGMREQLRDMCNPVYDDTWDTGFNDLTWALRHANISYEAVVNVNGNITIRYNLSDRLDSNPQDGRTEEYNRISELLGKPYHEWLGASAPDVSGSWEYDSTHTDSNNAPDPSLLEKYGPLAKDTVCAVAPNAGEVVLETGKEVMEAKREISEAEGILDAGGEILEGGAEVVGELGEGALEAGWEGVKKLNPFN